MGTPLEAVARLREIVEGHALEGAGGKSKAYDEAMTLVDGLDSVSRTDSADHGYTSEKVEELRWHLKAIAGRGDRKGHPVQQHIVWAYTALDSLESSSCFGTSKRGTDGGPDSETV